MREGWVIKKLGVIAKATYGYTEKTSFKEIGPKFLRITDIQDEKVNYAVGLYGAAFNMIPSLKSTK